MARPKILNHLYILFVSVSVFVLSSCSGVEIVGATETHVWVKNPVLSIGGSHDLAQEHCAKYGKTAVLESDLAVATGADSILVYVCE